ncbi:hypothetical protein [Alphabaculovirus altersperidaniae]|uniref:Uncharacterized protein n=1 Tax=Spodoptera eridania nucleopolyhedrovirus TaxID=2315721 RepID=A0ABX6TRL2_9ABAC|nr:hypothetical protein QKS47_gp031 [Spodoptera eridania nucleopolyhedrovirus]QNV47786.1 hypothetical protein [Spodoptera eridania nucleopolyhedrovirus]
MYYKFEDSLLKVFANNDTEPLIFTSSQYNAADKSLIRHYEISCLSSVKVTLDSQNVMLQAVFQCEDRVMCVVNARDERQPIMFDGFVYERDDECKTKAFCVGSLKELNDEHGLCVRDMVRAMECPTILHVYINEARISYFNSTTTTTLANICTNDDDGVHFDELIHQIRESTIIGGGATRTRPPPTKFNNTNWAPVSCKTGKRLLTATIYFHSTFSNKL